MIGSKILRQSPPCGVKLEGTIIGTPLPGTLVMPQPNQGPTVGGRMNWVPLAPSADFSTMPFPGVVVLTEDEMQGKTFKDAYVSGTRCFMYAPLVGEELNVVVAQPGTGTGPGFWKPGTPLGAAAANPGQLKIATSNPLFVVSEYTSEQPPTGTLTDIVLAMCCNA